MTIKRVCLGTAWLISGAAYVLLLAHWGWIVLVASLLGGGSSVIGRAFVKTWTRRSAAQDAWLRELPPGFQFRKSVTQIIREDRDGVADQDESDIAVE